jgi:hypothetical protein
MLLFGSYSLSVLGHTYPILSGGALNCGVTLLTRLPMLQIAYRRRTGLSSSFLLYA